MNCRPRPSFPRLILALLAVIALIWVLNSLGCYNRQDIVKHIPASKLNEKAWIIYNSQGMGRVRGLPECACGMRDDDFKLYVEGRTKGVDVIKIKWETRITLEGEYCLSGAIVYLKNK